MRPAQAWKILGIASGSDVAAIKRAYAAKLKAIDPDREIEAFLQLRAAFELARRLAGQDSPIAAPADPDVKPPAPATPDAATARAPEPPAVVAERDPRADLADLMWGAADPAPGAAERAALAMIRHPCMDNIHFANETEIWLAQLAIDTIPRADSILPLLEAHFGWRRFDDMVRLDPAISGALQRLKDLEAVERLRSPMHRWHFFYAMLGQPAPPAISRRDLVLYGENMGEMLDSLRFHNPGLLWSLDCNHVRLWEDAVARRRINPATPRADGISWFGWLVTGAILANILALAS